MVGDGAVVRGEQVGILVRGVAGQRLLVAVRVEVAGLHMAGVGVGVVAVGGGGQAESGGLVHHLLGGGTGLAGLAEGCGGVLHIACHVEPCGHVGGLVPLRSAEEAHLQVGEVVDVGRPVTAAQVSQILTGIHAGRHLQHLEAGLLLFLHTAYGEALRFGQLLIVFRGLALHRGQLVEVPGIDEAVVERPLLVLVKRAVGIALLLLLRPVITGVGVVVGLTGDVHAVGCAALLQGGRGCDAAADIGVVGIGTGDAQRHVGCGADGVVGPVHPRVELGVFAVGLALFGIAHGAVAAAGLVRLRDDDQHGTGLRHAGGVDHLIERLRLGDHLGGGQHAGLVHRVHHTGRGDGVGATRGARTVGIFDLASRIVIGVEVGLGDVLPGRLVVHTSVIRGRRVEAHADAPATAGRNGRRRRGGRRDGLLFELVDGSHDAHGAGFGAGAAVRVTVDVAVGFGHGVFHAAQACCGGDLVGAAGVGVAVEVGDLHLVRHILRRVGDGAGVGGARVHGDVVEQYGAARGFGELFVLGLGAFVRGDGGQQCGGAAAGLRLAQEAQCGFEPGFGGVPRLCIGPVVPIRQCLGHQYAEY